MDRIEGLLDQLHAESAWEMVSEKRGQALQHRERRIDLQEQIADEYRELLAACNDALITLKSVKHFLHEHELDSIEYLEVAITKAKGES